MRGFAVGVCLIGSTLLPLAATASEIIGPQTGGPDIGSIESKPLTPTQSQQLVGRFQQSLARCWNLPVVLLSMAEGNQASVVVLIKFERDGRLSAEPKVLDVVVPKSGYKVPWTKASVKAALAKSVVNAVKKCTPLGFLSDYQANYTSWRQIRMKFAGPQ